MTWPLISDATGATPSPLPPQEYLENVRAEFELEGMELEVVSELPSEGAEVLELPLEEVSGEVIGWKEHVVVLGIAGRSLE